MRVSRLLHKLWAEKKEFVTSEILKDYCKGLDTDYDTAVKNFVHRGHLTRIFRGMFYVRPPEGPVLGRGRYNHLELVAKGIGLKGVESWYFGLHSALKLNGMTHEYFAVERGGSVIPYSGKSRSALQGTSSGLSSLPPGCLVLG